MWTYLHIGHRVSEHSTILCRCPGTSARAPSVNAALVNFTESHCHYGQLANSLMLPPLVLLLFGDGAGGGGGGWELIRGWVLINFPTYRVGAYSRWALIRGWALNRINMGRSKLVQAQTQAKLMNITRKVKTCRLAKTEHKISTTIPYLYWKLVDARTHANWT